MRKENIDQQSSTDEQRSRIAKGPQPFGLGRASCRALLLLGRGGITTPLPHRASPASLPVPARVIPIYEMGSGAMRVINPPALFELHALCVKMAECRGPAPHPAQRDALVSTEARPACPVDIPGNGHRGQDWSAWQDLHLQPSRFERDASSLGHARVLADCHPVPPVRIALTLNGV